MLLLEVIQTTNFLKPAFPEHNYISNFDIFQWEMKINYPPSTSQRLQFTALETFYIDYQIDVRQTGGSDTIRKIVEVFPLLDYSRFINALQQIKKMINKSYRPTSVQLLNIVIGHDKLKESLYQYYNASSTQEWEQLQSIVLLCTKTTFPSKIPNERRIGRKGRRKDSNYRIRNTAIHYRTYVKIRNSNTTRW